ncbi:hypothetical protein AWB67_05695 [Caballeronia terrestris]|uniref:Uncharacterized protein n=1 Tax=Caballeronia terrestris TaxID=1226301 RepID=A0A158KJA3_9BURK|nr:hypothetical protein AWB67_05695 [Caballeronia terrestris]
MDPSRAYSIEHGPAAASASSVGDGVPERSASSSPAALLCRSGTAGKKRVAVAAADGSDRVRPEGGPQVAHTRRICRWPATRVTGPSVPRVLDRIAHRPG